MDIQTEIRPGYMYFRCGGVYSITDVRELYERALDTAASEGITAVLIDHRDLVGEPLTTLQRYELGVHVAKLQSDPARRIRLVIVGNEPFIDPQRFGETVARNRGAIGRVFTDFEEAVAWIEKGG